MLLKKNINGSQVTKNNKIVFLTDLIEQRLRKESEISYFEKQLKEIEDKLFFLRKEQELTVTIIDILEQEKIIDFEYGKAKLLDKDGKAKLLDKE